MGDGLLVSKRRAPSKPSPGCLPASRARFPRGDPGPREMKNGTGAMTRQCSTQLSRRRRLRMLGLNLRCVLSKYAQTLSRRVSGSGDRHQVSHAPSLKDGSGKKDRSVHLYFHIHSVHVSVSVFSFRPDRWAPRTSLRQVEPSLTIVCWREAFPHTSPSVWFVFPLRAC